MIMILVRLEFENVTHQDRESKAELRIVYLENVCTFSLLMCSLGSKDQTDSTKRVLLSANFEALTAALMTLGFRKTWRQLGITAVKILEFHPKISS